jgi:FixJ family two-component response regulator
MKPKAGVPHACIIDDEQGIRQLLGILCESMGLTAHGFGSAERFLARSGSDFSCCGIILLDLDLPGMSGLQLIRVLRQRGFAGPIIVVSAEPRPDAIAQMPSLGVTALIPKPFSVAVVRARIHEALAQ